MEISSFWSMLICMQVLGSQERRLLYCRPAAAISMHRIKIDQPITTLSSYTLIGFKFWVWGKFKWFWIQKLVQNSLIRWFCIEIHISYLFKVFFHFFTNLNAKLTNEMALNYFLSSKHFKSNQILKFWTPQKGSMWYSWQLLPSTNVLF
jgi:hypothetical protein